DFVLELLAELARHRARATHPPTDLGGDARQFLRPQDDQGQDGNDQDFGEADFEHRRAASGARGRADQAWRSFFSALAFVSANSASGASLRSFFMSSASFFCCSSSPSFMAFLKPFTAPPRSCPMVFSFFAPKTRSAMARMTRSSFIPIPMTQLLRKNPCVTVWGS